MTKRIPTSPYAEVADPGRKLLPKSFMEHMEFVTVTKGELLSLMATWDYNPTYYYPKGLRKRKNEVGHNAMYRFIKE